MALDRPVPPDEERKRQTGDLMDARRAIGAALQRGDQAALKSARAAVDGAKVALAERGPVRWTDGAPDFNRRMAGATPYAAWYWLLEEVDNSEPKAR